MGIPAACRIQPKASVKENRPSPVPAVLSAPVKLPAKTAFCFVSTPACRSCRSNRSTRQAGSPTSSIKRMPPSTDGKYGVPSRLTNTVRLPPQSVPSASTASPENGVSNRKFGEVSACSKRSSRKSFASVNILATGPCQDDRPVLVKSARLKAVRSLKPTNTA